MTCVVDGCTDRVKARSWCNKHYSRWRVHGDPHFAPPSPEERFWAKVDRTEGCWLWTGPQAGGGYGQFSIDGKFRPAHRVAYEWIVGPIQPGLVLDHLCVVRLCVNPAHLEPVTQRENVLRSDALSAQNARKTHCKYGHEFTPENIKWTKQGWRTCRTCTNDGQKRRYHERKRVA